MKKITRPTDILETGIMLHLAEYLLEQATEILANVELAPSQALPDPLGERVTNARSHSQEALEWVGGLRADSEALLRTC